MSGLWQLATFHMIGLIDHWQTLTAGLFAIFAALIGSYFVVKQTSLAKQQEADRIFRRFNAARSILPLTLSYLSAYARDSATSLKAIYSQRQGEEIPPTIRMPRFPELPADVIGQLKDMVEVSDNHIGDAIAKMLAEIQVQNARLGDLKQWPENPGNTLVLVSNIEAFILDAAEIYARAAALFEFARRQNDKVTASIESQQLVSALNQLGFYSDEFPRLHQGANRRISFNNDNPQT